MPSGVRLATHPPPSGGLCVEVPGVSKTDWRSWRSMVGPLAALSALVWLSAGCSQDPVEGNAQLDLRIVRGGHPAADAAAGAGTAKRATDRVIAAVLDASDLSLGAIPVSAAYEDMVADYGSQRLALTTWPQWRALLARHYTILDEQQLAVDGNTATGTLGAAFGWNLVAVAFLDSTAVTWIGIGPGNALPGGTGTAVVRVEPPVGYLLPGTAPLQVVITSPTDDEILTTPVANVRGFLNDPFLEAGTLQLDTDETARALPLLTGFFAAPVNVTTGVHQVTVAVDRARTEEQASATQTFFYQAPLGISITLPPNPGVTTQAQVSVSGQLSDQSPLDSIVVYVNNVRALQSGWEGNEFSSDLVPLQRGANVVRATAYRGSEVASDQATVTRRDPLYVRVLEIGGANGFFVDGNLGNIDTNLDAPSPTFSIEGGLPGKSRLHLRWRNLTSPGNGSIGVTDPTTGGVIESPFHPVGAFFEDDLALPSLAGGRYTFFIIYHNDTQSFGACEVDQMILYVGDAADGEVFTLGQVDDSGADLNWGALGNMGFGSPVPRSQTLAFRGESGDDRCCGGVRWNPGDTGPPTGEGIDLYFDGNYDWYTFNAGIPGPNATYVDDILVPNRYFYGQHTATLALRPSTDATAGVFIDLVSFQFDTPPQFLNVQRRFASQPREALFPRAGK